MSRRSSFATTFVVVTIASVAHAQTTAPATTFDRLVAEYRPYVDVDAPLGFGIKVRAISSDPYKFWRGTKGLFYSWCRTNAADWLADAGARVASHGDVHVGNVGTYATAWGRIAFGLVDYDDASMLPPELDVLDACITTRLVARAQRLPLDVAAADRATFDAYLTALKSGRTASDLLAGDLTVDALVKKGSAATYADELAKLCTPDGAFRRTVGKGDKVTDLLTPLPPDGLAEAIAEACRNDADLASRMLVTDVDGLRAKFRGACVRTRLGSSGSQGLEKLFVRLDRPFRDVDGDAILYFKQQIPTAAERAGLTTRGDDESPGARCARMIDALARPRPVVNSHATFAGRSYVVSLKEPWGEDLDPAKIGSADELMRVTRAIATALGAAHGAAGHADAIAARMTPQALDSIRERADRYVVDQQAWFDAFVSDPRTGALAARCDAAVRDAIAAAKR